MDDFITTSIKTRDTNSFSTIRADVCVLGAGISSISAAIEAARLGRRVVLVDGAPALGGQAIGSIIGTIIGLYSHGAKPYQLTHGIADELIAELGQAGALHKRQSTRQTITSSGFSKMNTPTSFKINQTVNRLLDLFEIDPGQDLFTRWQGMTHASGKELPGKRAGKTGK